MLQLLLIVLLPKILSIEHFSNYIKAVAVIGIVEITSDFGARVWAITKLSKNGAQSGSDVLARAIFVKAIFTLLSLAVLIALPWSILPTFDLLLVLFVACLQPSTDPFVWYFRAKERLDLEALTVIFWRLSNVFGALLFAVAFERITPILIWFICTSVVRMCVEWRFMKAICSLNTLHISVSTLLDKFITALFSGELRAVFQICFPIGIAFFVMSFFQRIGVIYVGALSTDYAVAVFGIAFSLVASAGFVATSITNSMYPALVRSIEDNDENGTETKLVKQFLLISGVCVLVVGAFKLFGSYLVNLLYPAMGEELVAHIGILIIGLYPSTLNLSLKFTLNALQLNWFDVFSNFTGIIVLLCSYFLFADLTVGLAIACGWCFGELAILLWKLTILKYRTEIALVRMLSVVILTGFAIILLARI